MNNPSRENNKYLSDWKIYRGFIEVWKKGITGEKNALCQIVSQISLKICSQYKCNRDAGWIYHTCLIALSRENYVKNSSLKKYIRKIMLNEIKRRRAGD